mmetsp:Transcript_95893/g.256281  ORF Transcript_95893/g.256281 Transcript_95893/m.256281 type:complete len:257 (-) Transcript_95893:250-1020(-)
MARKSSTPPSVPLCLLSATPSARLRTRRGSIFRPCFAAPWSPRSRSPGNLPDLGTRRRSMLPRSGRAWPRTSSGPNSKSRCTTQHPCSTAWPTTTPVWPRGMSRKTCSTPGSTSRRPQGRAWADPSGSRLVLGSQGRAWGDPSGSRLVLGSQGSTVALRQGVRDPVPATTGSGLGGGWPLVCRSAEGQGVRRAARWPGRRGPPVAPPARGRRVEYGVTPVGHSSTPSPPCPGAVLSVAAPSPEAALGACQYRRPRD